VSAVVFRCNAGPNVGIGHVVRCRELALELGRRGYASVMVGPGLDHAGPRDEAIFADWLPRPQWVSGAAEGAALAQIAETHGARHAVLDDYRVDVPFQEALLGPGIRFMQQFDGSRPPALFWADMVVNASPYERLDMYAEIMRKPGAAGLFGPAYAILRPEFPPAEVGDAGRPVRRVLLQFGGGDDRGAVLFALETLLAAAPQQVDFLVVSGRANPRNPEIAAFVAAHGAGRVALHVDPPAVAPLFASCDLAVMGGGTSTYEAAACGLPMLILAMADNQVRQAQGWVGLGGAEFLGRAGAVDAAELGRRFLALVRDDARRAAMARAGRNLVDGAGVRRLADHLVGELTA